jgi:hypothetical protein
MEAGMPQIKNEDLFSGAKSLLIEAKTLNFVEIQSS